MKSRFDNHHLLFERAAYQGNSLLVNLRENSGLIAFMDRTTHNALHDRVACIPPPSCNMAQVALHHLRTHGNALEQADKYMQGIDEAMRHPKASDIEKKLGELILYSVEAERPFVRDGMLNGTTYLDLAH